MCIPWGRCWSLVPFLTLLIFRNVVPRKLHFIPVLRQPTICTCRSCTVPALAPSGQKCSCALCTVGHELFCFSQVTIGTVCPRAEVIAWYSLRSFSRCGWHSGCDIVRRVWEEEVVPVIPIVANTRSRIYCVGGPTYTVGSHENSRLILQDSDLSQRAPPKECSESFVDVEREIFPMTSE